MNNTGEVFLGNLKGPEGSIIIEQKMDEESKNAISCKAVKEYVDETIGYINQALSEIVDGLPVEDEGTEEA